MEDALKFNMSLEGYLKTYSNILPSKMTDLVKIADKEKYDSQVERAAVLKSMFIQEFFDVQSNLDLLTSSQRVQLDDYLKLTKNGKQTRAETVYENIFEPAVETLKKVRKAEEVGRSRAGFASEGDSQSAYRDRLVNMARKSHLGEKGT